MKRDWKKALSLILAVSLVFGMSTAAFAREVVEEEVYGYTVQEADEITEELTGVVRPHGVDSEKKYTISFNVSTNAKVTFSGFTISGPDGWKSAELTNNLSNNKVWDYSGLVSGNEFTFPDVVSENETEIYKLNCWISGNGQGYKAGAHGSVSTNSGNNVYTASWNAPEKKAAPPNPYPIIDNPLEWSSAGTPWLFRPCFEYNGLESTHVVDGKEIPVSVNNGLTGKTRNLMTDFEEKANGVVSSNVFQLNDNTYLLIIYTVVDDGLGGEVGEGATLLKGSTSHNKKYEPVVTFSGRTYCQKGTKANGSKNGNILIGASIIEYHTSTHTAEIVLNSMSANDKKKYDLQIKAKVKNTKYATVSRNMNSDGDYEHVSTYYNKKGDPYFTIKITGKGKAKLFASVLKTCKDIKGNELQKARFTFQIRRGIFGVANPNLMDPEERKRAADANGDHDDDFKDRDSISGNYTYHGFGILNIDTTSKKIKGNERNPVVKLKYKTAKIKNKEKLYNLVQNKSGSEGDKGDYTVKLLYSRGSEFVPAEYKELAVVVKPCGNFEDNNACPVYRNKWYQNTKGKWVIELRGGFYYDEDHYYINSVDE